MSAKIYNINRLSLILGGLPIDSGFGENDVFTFTPEGPLYGDKIGADGEVTRFATNERRATLKLTLMQSSDQNAKLSALVNLGLALNNGSDVGAAMIKDNNGTTTIASGTAWINGFPEWKAGREIQELEWEIRMVWDLCLIGGN